MEQFQAPSLQKLVDYYSAITSAANDLFSYIVDLYDLSSFESRVATIEKVNMNLFSLFDTAITQLPEEMKKQISSLDVDRARNELKISCDPHQIITLFSKIIENAVQYSRKNCRLKVVIHRAKNPDNHAAREMVEILISDEGVGIPENELETVFHSFVQSSRTRDNSGGKGIGLAICRHIVSLHQGEIDIVNNSGAGVTVRIRLPE